MKVNENKGAKQKIFLRLVGFELRKSILSRWVVVFLVVLLAVNAWKITSTYNSSVKKWQEYEKYEAVYEKTYATYSGGITTEKIDDFMEIFSPLQIKSDNMTLSYAYSESAWIYSETVDFEFFNDIFYEQLSYDYLYVNTAAEIVENAEELISFYEEAGNFFEAAKNKAIQSDFSGRVISDFYDMRGTSLLINYDYSSFLVLLLTIFGLCGVFVKERESRMYELLRTSRYGGGATTAAKFGASFLYILGVNFLFWTEDFLLFFTLSDSFDTLSQPCYAIQYLELTPLSMTVLEYFLWAAFLKTLGFLCCACIMLLVSSLVSSALSSFVAGGAILIGLSLLQEVPADSVALKWFDPFWLIITRELVARDTFVNVFGQAVHTYVFIIAGVMLTMAVLFLGILVRNSGRKDKLAGKSRFSDILRLGSHKRTDLKMMSTIAK
ncbi:MAG: hypothetical protein LUE29_09165 [Lachnospiraceae bacterium]|nr:hypothetical protein [Lachnospiraceae bacterium]